MRLLPSALILLAFAIPTRTRTPPSTILARIEGMVRRLLRPRAADASAR